MYKPFIVACLLATALFSCKKETTTTKTENVNLFYRLVSKDFDEQMAYSRVIVARATVELKSSINDFTSEQFSDTFEHFTANTTVDGIEAFEGNDYFSNL